MLISAAHFVKIIVCGAKMKKTFLFELDVHGTEVQNNEDLLRTR